MVAEDEVDHRVGIQDHPKQYRAVDDIAAAPVVLELLHGLGFGYWRW